MRRAGADHVDSHRSVLLMASPFARRGAVDHTFYTTSGVLRTIELILGLPPMSQYDAAATPMYNAFSGVPNLGAFRRLGAARADRRTQSADGVRRGAVAGDGFLGRGPRAGGAAERDHLALDQGRDVAGAAAATVQRFVTPANRAAIDDDDQ